MKGRVLAVVGCSLFTFLLPMRAFSQYPVLQWAKMTTGNVESIQRTVATDADGNVYIHGVFFGTVDFDPGSGTANITPVPYGSNVYIAKYDAGGNYLWIKNIPINASYGGNSMTLDANSSIYIAGFYSGTNVDFDPGTGTAYLSSVSGSSDIYFAKYDINGNYLWAKSMGSTGTDAATEILTDANGNVFLAGTFNETVDFNPDAGTNNLTSSGSSDVFFAKYDANGNFQWAKQIGGSNMEDVRDIAIDGDGNIFLTGSFYGTADFNPGSGSATLTSGGANDLWCAKYDMNGNYLWAFQIGGTAYDIGCALKTDASGNVFLTGTFNNTVDADPGSGNLSFTAALGGGSFFGMYDSQGNMVWAKQLPLNTANLDILLDACGSLFIAGSYLSGGASTIDLDPGPGTAMVSVPANLPPPYYNIWSRYDLTGNYKWGMVFGQSCYCSVSGYKSSLAYDANGYVYYAGIFNAPFFSTSTVDFDPGGGTANLLATSSVDNTFFAKYQCLEIILPVELISFYGESLPGLNRLHWSTASEINNDHFEIEKSPDAISFEMIGEVQGSGNTGVRSDYSFDDGNPFPGTNYYCLRQVDYKGDFEYSQVITVEGTFPSIMLEYASLGSGLFEIHLSGIDATFIIVYDLSGRIAHTVQYPDSVVPAWVRLDLTGCPDGIYFVTVLGANPSEAFRLMIVK